MCDCKEVKLENRLRFLELIAKGATRTSVAFKHFLIEKHPGWIEEWAKTQYEVKLEEMYTTLLQSKCGEVCKEQKDA